MSREAKKLTNMVWRTMGESIVYSMLLMILGVYALHYYGYLTVFQTWEEVLLDGFTMLVVAVALGGAFGFWHSNKMKRRLEKIHDVMLLLEKGNLSRMVPDLGEDEIGRIGDQLNRISKKWEEQVTSLQRLSTSNAELAEKVRFSAVTEERQRLARELHDAVSQQLFAISMTATALGRIVDKDYEKAKRQVALIEEMASVAQSEMRALLLHLRPVRLEGQRLSEGLEDLLEELRHKVPIEIVFEKDEEIRMTKGIEDHLFRIVQEALSNTLRHSKASKLEIRLQQRADMVRLTIRDNGVGFDLETKKHASYGLVSMRERVNEIGGAMNLITAPGKGVRIDIRVPIAFEETEGTEAEYGNAD